MKLNNPKKAQVYFLDKMSFTTGPIELNAMIERNEEINIIDVRRPADYAQGHIPGAVNLFSEQWNSLHGLEKDKINIVYCYSQVCHLAAKACLVFAEHGYSVMELEGGFDVWKNYGLKIEQ